MLALDLLTALSALSMASASPILQSSKWRRNDLAGLDFEMYVATPVLSFAPLADLTLSRAHPRNESRHCASPFTPMFVLTHSINLARNLESLELAYWNQGLENYTDADFSNAGLDGYRDYIRQFRDHEIVHFTVLNDAAGGGFQNCTYNTFDVYDIPSYLAQGQVVTTVGEGAFIGALGSELDTSHV